MHGVKRAEPDLLLTAMSDPRRGAVRPLRSENMKDISRETVDSIVRACQQAAGCGLMRCRSDNLSMRVDGGRLLVKASRSWMARVVPDDISLCTIADGSL